MPDTPRAIVLGAGVIGLTGAIALREAGFAADIIADRIAPDITSERAAAFFYPYAAGDDPRISRWCACSHRRFDDLRRRSPDAGIAPVLLREYFRAPRPTAPAWRSFIADFTRLAAPPPFVDGWSASLFTIDMRAFLPWLHHRFTVELGGRITLARIDSWDDPMLARQPLIVNCTGLGAEVIAHDPRLLPIRGQVLHVVNTIDLRDCLLDEDRPDRPTYIVPFADRLVIGGTRETHERDETPTDEAMNELLRRANDLLEALDLPILEGDRLRVLRRAAGIRPARRRDVDDDARFEIRLERETLADGRIVLHHYGHGGAGVTLSWGGAEDVIRLARAAFVPSSRQADSTSG